MKQQLFLDWSPDPRDHAALLQKVAAANLASAGPGGYRNIAVVIRDPETGEAVSGVWGVILYGLLFIDLLFVAQPDRGQGLGSRLLAAAEDAARQDGCVGAWLSVYAFQAPEFYQKNGYERFGGLDTAARGAPDQQLYLYRKSFDR